VSDVGQETLIEVIDSHQQGEIIEVLMEQPLEVRQRVTEVNVDMWGGFLSQQSN
jgi:transposase